MRSFFSFWSDTKIPWWWPFNETTQRERPGSNHRPSDRIYRASARSLMWRGVYFTFSLLQLLLSILVPHFTLLTSADGHRNRTLGRKCHPCLVQMPVAATSLTWGSCWTHKVPLPPPGIVNRVHHKVPLPLLPIAISCLLCWPFQCCLVTIVRTSV